MNNFDRMNGQSWQSSPTNNWGNSGYQQPFNTNIVYVTSPEEALMRTTQRNSEAVYFHQDQPIFYRVRVDMEGRKFWQPFNYGSQNSDLTTPATKADFNELSKRLYELESRLNISVTSNTDKEVNNVESNG